LQPVPARITATLILAVLVACGGEPPATTGAGNQSAPVAGASQEVRACDLLDLATAITIIGTGTEHPGGDTERDTCIYSNAGVAMLTIQIGRAELYDQMSIPMPHTAVSIGDRGRYNVQTSGAVAVEFTQGDYKVTLGVRPIGSSNSSHLDPLLAAARGVAGQLP